MDNKRLKVAVMGGGTGTFPVISALKRLDSIDISTIIAVSDSGGSTGRIRDEFGFQPVGDLRQSLAALAENQGEDWIRKILLYRFDKGEGLKGHNLGNLILTALQDMTGDTTQALEIAEKVFRLEGTVIPVTKDTVDLKINYQDGTTALGEHILDLKDATPKKINSIELVPPTNLNPLAKQALLEADGIIIGPGDYYASLMAVLTPGDIKDVFSQVKGQVIYILNLMTRLTQTRDMPASQHVKGIEAVIGRPVDRIIVNNGKIAETTLEIYAREGEHPVVDDFQNDPRVIRQDIVSDTVSAQKAYDTAHRSLLRHDAHKVEVVLRKVLSK